MMRSLLIPAELLCGSGGHDGVGPTPGTITCWARAPQNLAACILGPRHPCLFVTVFALPWPCQEDSGSEKGVEMPTAPVQEGEEEEEEEAATHSKVSVGQAYTMLWRSYF